MTNGQPAKSHPSSCRMIEQASSEYLECRHDFKISIGRSSEKDTGFLWGGQRVCCGLVKHILRETDEKSEAENLNAHAFFRSLYDELLDKYLCVIES